MDQILWIIVVLITIPFLYKFLKSNYNIERYLILSLVFAFVLRAMAYLMKVNLQLFLFSNILFGFFVFLILICIFKIMTRMPGADKLYLAKISRDKFVKGFLVVCCLIFYSIAQVNTIITGKGYLPF